MLKLANYNQFIKIFNNEEVEDLRVLEELVFEDSFLSKGQLEFVEELKNEGYEYFTWGHKFSKLEGEEICKELFKMGYNPFDQKILMISNDKGEVYKIYFIKKLENEG